MLTEGEIAVFMYRIYRFLHKCRIPLIPPVLARITRHFTRILLPPEVKAGEGLKFNHIGNVVIHKDTVIGKNCSIYHNVTIGTKRPDLPNDKAPTIRDNVTIYTGAIVLKDVPDKSIIKAGQIWC